LAWEEETVPECSSLLCNIVLQYNILDRWRWVLDPINGYSVKETFQYLTMSVTPVEHDLFDAAWLKQVPLKVSVFVWRLLRNRLPTKCNLLRMRVLHHDDTSCVGGCSCAETRFIFFSDVTSLVACGTVYINGSVFLSYLQSRFTIIFTSLVIWRGYCDLLIRVIWHACVWVVWMARNNRIFKGKVQDLVHLLDNVKFMSFLWLKVNKFTSAFSYNDWCGTL
jgi:hypothetical protein